MKILSLILLASVLTACGGGDDTFSTSSAPNVFDKYVGTWNVSYSGGDRGTCTLTIRPTVFTVTNSVSGTCRSSVLGVSFSADGEISSTGYVTAGRLFGDGTRLEGTLSGSTGNGTWRTTAGATSVSGSWQATR